MEAASMTEATPKFLQRTSLMPGEYRANFRQIDRDAIRLVRSSAARQVTKLMAHIYLCLVDAPVHLRERDGVLRFAGEVREEKTVTAWEQLIEMLEVADGTAHKALKWMREQRLIGYHAGKNGVGIRIFLNRAVDSVKRETERSQKNLQLVSTSNGEPRVSPNAMPFNNYGRDNVDPKINPHAPKNGADSAAAGKTSSDPEPILTSNRRANTAHEGRSIASANGNVADALPVDEIVNRLRSALEPSLRAVAIQTAQREHERTREWLNKHGIPKATRVAQKETYNVLRNHGLVNTGVQRTRTQQLEVGRSTGSYTAPDAHPHTAEEIMELAETCVALLETQGRSIEVTLSEISSEVGGWLLAEDAPKVRETAHRLMAGRSVQGKLDVRSTSHG